MCRRGKQTRCSTVQGWMWLQISLIMKILHAYKAVILILTKRKRTEKELETDSSPKSVIRKQKYTHRHCQSAVFFWMLHANTYSHTRPSTYGKWSISSTLESYSVTERQSQSTNEAADVSGLCHFLSLEFVTSLNWVIERFTSQGQFYCCLGQVGNQTWGTFSYLCTFSYNR